MADGAVRWFERTCALYLQPLPLLLLPLPLLPMLRERRRVVGLFRYKANDPRPGRGGYMASEGSGERVGKSFTVSRTKRKPLKTYLFYRVPLPLLVAAAAAVVVSRHNLLLLCFTLPPSLLADLLLADRNNAAAACVSYTRVQRRRRRRVVCTKASEERVCICTYVEPGRNYCIFLSILASF